MDWSYIAGFFDGEGCVSVAPVSARPGTTRCSLTWYNTHRASLESMQAFMGAGRLRKRPSKGRAKACFGLHVENCEEMLRVGRALLPYLLVKRDQMERLLDVVAVKTPMPTFGNLARLGPEEVRRLYRDERLSQSEIARRVGVTQGAVKVYMARHDIPARTITEANLLRWQNTDPEAEARRVKKLSRTRKRQWKDPAYRDAVAAGKANRRKK